MSALRTAQLAGLVKYAGAPCRYCRSVVRWVCNRTCVQCGTRRPLSASDGQAREAARARGAGIYTSPVRCRCGDTIRRVKHGGCLTCGSTAGSAS